MELNILFVPGIYKKNDYDGDGIIDTEDKYPVHTSNSKKELPNHPYPYNINGKLYYKTIEEANANDENNQHTTITFNENIPSNFKLYTPIIFNGTRPSNYVSTDPIPPDATSTNLFIQDYKNLNKGWSKLSYPTKEIYYHNSDDGWSRTSIP